jgi:SNF2-related domain
MLLREAENVSDELTLWDCRTVRGRNVYEPSAYELQALTELTRYTHKVTGFTTLEKIVECRGGLLADDMGMGKSLSVLTLIVQTEQESKEFCHSASLSDDTELCQPHSRATLIITPKSSEYGMLVGPF